MFRSHLHMGHRFGHGHFNHHNHRFGCRCHERGFSHCRCGCNFNAYRFPGPEPKRHRILDTTGLRIHTDKFVGETCFHEGPCCEPIPVKISEEIRSFIIRAATDCLEPSNYYTLYINHPLSDEIWKTPSFIQVEKCGLFPDPVKLIYTETVFPMSCFDGHPKCGIPADPAFPDQDLICVDGFEERREHNGPLAMPSRFERRHEETRLIPVELDLHGQTAFGDNYVHGIGPHPKTLVLFYTNRGTFSLTRPFFGQNRRTDY